jgi:hypothetical protein
LGARTVHRRLKEPDFAQRLQQMRADIVQRTVGMLIAGSVEAGKTLIVLQEASQPGSVRLGAARTVLEFAIRLREIAELEQRIAALESQLKSTTAMGSTSCVKED